MRGLFLGLLMALGVPHMAQAACSNPAGLEGEVIYNASHKVMQYCDNASWIGMGWKGAPSTPSDGALGAVQLSNGSAGFMSDGLLIWDVSNKRLGIGTATPTVTLDIAGRLHLHDTVGAGSFITYRNDTGYLALTPQSGSSAHGAYVSITGTTNTSQVVGAGGIQMGVSGVSPAMLIKGTTGYVGVGTSTPRSRLDVNGIITGGFGAAETGGTTDWNHITNARPGSGHTLLYGNATNGPGSSGPYYFYPFSFEYNSKNGSGNLTQFAIPYGNPAFAPGQEGLYIRSRYGASWGSWRYIPMQAVSDYRLKDNVTPYTGGLDAVMRMRPVHFTMKETGREEDGFIAHEMAEIAPYSVTGKKDEVDESGTPRYQNMDYGRITPILARAIQELKAENDDLRARLEALEAKQP